MAHCLKAFNDSPAIDEIYIVTKAGTVDEMKRVALQYGIAKTRAILEGGDSRQESVQTALEYLSSLYIEPRSIVAIHDGDRPNITLDIIEKNFEMAESKGASVTAIPATNSAFLSPSGKSVRSYLKRSDLYLAQTPQTFRFDWILRAHREYGSPSATDDASLVRKLGKPVHIVEGSVENYKINTKEDGHMFSLKKEGRI